MSTHRETSGAILIDCLGRFLFQQRDYNPEILYPGMIGLFGGHREGSETFLECVVREVYEEISYFVPSERFAHLVSYEGTDPRGGTIRAEIFVTNNLPPDRLVITEGTLLTISPEDFATVEPRFSPSARFAVNAFLNEPTKRTQPFAHLSGDWSGGAWRRRRRQSMQPHVAKIDIRSCDAL